MDFLMVGCGGAVGAAARYAITLLPFGGDFPVLTLITNFLGAVLIGFLTGLAESRGVSARGMLFWKTGVCGGFTTFSTFSLETMNLFRHGKSGMGALYVVLSVGLCAVGVMIGWLLGRKIS
ncbi:MAG: fluoride efflux transporter CrcB [Acidaminococcus sp.]|jgi:CrcB protein|nr:fluoride efflux transporter CrcB [Acidaminococcus sp.]MCI2100570.1 fluoride efflux transporter CrcB [Acidaminococcus sp.]MCI2114885.1 fluoride efflux transporter CrcB [Acidaminococcus sp.]MCI2116993.1 fluoride efflux transporter CrcB [Acidaminococcus sp.]